MLNEIVVVVVGVACLLYPVQIYFQERSEKAELQSWLVENGLLEYEAKLHKFGNICIILTCVVRTYVLGNRSLKLSYSNLA